MGQNVSFVSLITTATLGTVSWCIHNHARFFLPTRLAQLIPTASWCFTTFFLAQNMGRLCSYLLYCHLFSATLLSMFWDRSCVFFNRTFIYPVIGSVLPLIGVSFTPSVSEITMAVLLLIQMWSIAGSILISLFFPAMLISAFQPQRTREEELGIFLRYMDERGIWRGTIPSNNGVQLDAVIVKRQKYTDCWVIYFGGNAELMEYSVSGVLRFDEIVHANWVFYNSRGVGCSSGYVAEIRDLVDDGVAVARFLLEKYGVRRERLLLWGHSIGGGIAAAVARRLGGELPLLLDRTFSSLSEAAVPFSPFSPFWTRNIVQYTIGDLDVVADCTAMPNNRRLVIYHPMDEVIAFDVASLGRQHVLDQVSSDKSRTIELISTQVDSPHNSNLAEFSQRAELSDAVKNLFV